MVDAGGGGFAHSTVQDNLDAGQTGVSQIGWSTVTWRWDVALSFAGAQRSYVEQVAAELEAAGVRCFYDAHRQVELWGRHLADELPRVYAEDAAVVVVFVSADYAARDWTNLERRAALGRAVRERREYVLPARFDDTNLPGLLDDLVAVDLRVHTPQEFAGLVVAKLADLGIVHPPGWDATRQPRRLKIRKIRRRRVRVYTTAMAVVGAAALLLAALTYVNGSKNAADISSPTIEQLSVLTGATHYRVQATISNTTSDDQLITKVGMEYSAGECLSTGDKKIYLVGDQVAVTRETTNGAYIAGSVSELAVPYLTRMTGYIDWCSGSRYFEFETTIPIKRGELTTFAVDVPYTFTEKDSNRPLGPIFWPTDSDGNFRGSVGVEVSSRQKTLTACRDFPGTIDLKNDCAEPATPTSPKVLDTPDHPNKKPRNYLNHWVSSVAFAPDGQTLASGSYDDTVWLWDVADPAHPRQLATLKGHTGPVASMAFAPDGQTLVTGGGDGVARLWDVADPTHPHELATLEDRPGPVTSVVFASNGDTLATAINGDDIGTDRDGAIRLWDVADTAHPHPLAMLDDRLGTVTSVTFAPDGKTLATGGEDYEKINDEFRFGRGVRLWDVADPAHPRELTTLDGNTGLVFSMAISPGGRILATGSWDPVGDGNKVRLWNLAGPVRPRSLLATLENRLVASIAFAPDGDTLATGGRDDPTVRLWDVTDPAHPRELATLKGHTGRVESLAFSPDGRTLATGGGDGVRLWAID